MSDQHKLIEKVYAALNKMLTEGETSDLFACWHQDDCASLMLALGEREFGWKAVKKMLAQVATIISKAPVHSRIVPKLERWHETSEMAYCAIIEDIEAILQVGPPEKRHQQRSTMVFQKFHGEWKIVHWHNDAVSPLQETLSFILRHPHFDLDP